MGDLRFGIIGTGMMGCEHIRNLDALPGASLVAVADPDEGSRASAAEVATGDVQVHADHVEMLDRVPLDAVIIASPNHTHRDVLESLRGRAVHVMVEKPLCTTVSDCMEVVELAGSHEGLVWTGLEYRYMPAVSRFLERLAQGDAGRVRMVSIREHRFPFLDKVGHWNRFNRNTGGTLVEKCCHFFDLMNLAVGERPWRVMASGGQDVNHLDESYDGEVPDIYDNAFVIVDYPGGTRALLDLCMYAEGSRWEQELVAVGDRGKVEAHLPNFMELARGRAAELVVGSRGPGWPVQESAIGDDPRIRHHGSHHGASYLELLAFRDAVLAGGPEEVDVQDGLWSVAMGVAAQRSIEQNRPVELAEFGLLATDSLR
jgi:myo-inositol 2-dehydrogenase / D-chiro-inositol 1-dehydrogenase